jgi:hypothetical protein
MTTAMRPGFSKNNKNHDDDPVLADGEHMRVPLFMADAAAGLPGRRMLDAAAYRPGFRVAGATTGMTDAEKAAEMAEAVFQDRRLSHAYAQKDFTDRWSYKGMAWLASDEALAIYDQEVGRIFTDDDDDDDDADSNTGAGEHGARGPQQGDQCTVKSGRGAYGPEGAAGTIVEADGALVCMANEMIPLDAQGRKVLNGLVWQPNDSRNDSSGSRVSVENVGDQIGPGDSRRVSSRPFVGTPQMQKLYDQYDAEMSSAWKRGS